MLVRAPHRRDGGAAWALRAVVAVLTPKPSRATHPAQTPFQGGGGCFGGALGCGRAPEMPHVGDTAAQGVCLVDAISAGVLEDGDHQKRSQQLRKSVPVSESGSMAFSSLSFLICCDKFLICV